MNVRVRRLAYVIDLSLFPHTSGLNLWKTYNVEHIRHLSTLTKVPNGSCLPLISVFFTPGFFIDKARGRYFCLSCALTLPDLSDCWLAVWSIQVSNCFKIAGQFPPLHL